MIPVTLPSSTYAKACPQKQNKMEANSIWQPSPGEHVEVRKFGSVTRRGVVELVMYDHSGLWLAADGVEPRVFVTLGEGEQDVRPSPGYF